MYPIGAELNPRLNPARWSSDQTAELPGSQEAPVERLLRAIETHVWSEEEHLEQYRHFESEARDPTVRLLLRLILADEEQHHKTLRLLAQTLGDGIYWRQTPGSLQAGQGPEALAPEILEATRRFRRVEQEDSRELRTLARKCHEMRLPLFQVLLEAMASDSEKHAGLMKFLERAIAGTA